MYICIWVHMDLDMIRIWVGFFLLPNLDLKLRIECCYIISSAPKKADNSSGQPTPSGFIVEVFGLFDIPTQHSAPQFNPRLLKSN